MKVEVEVMGHGPGFNRGDEWAAEHRDPVDRVTRKPINAHAKKLP